MRNEAGPHNPCALHHEDTGQPIHLPPQNAAGMPSTRHRWYATGGNYSARAAFPYIPGSFSTRIQTFQDVIIYQEV